MTDRTIDQRTSELRLALEQSAATRSSRNTLVARIGLILGLAGIVTAGLGTLLSQSTDNPLDQSTDLSLGLLGVTLTLAGAALFLRGSFAEFLRFWLARLIHEQRRVPGSGQD